MVQTEAPSITTRLQARVDAQDEKIQNLTVAMKDLSASVSSMREAMKGLPDSIEKLMANLLNGHGKRSFVADSSIHNEVFGSGVKNPEGGFEWFFHENRSEEHSVGLFLCGLKEEIRNWVRALNPPSCDQAMDFARHVSIATAPPSEKMTKFNTVTSTGRYHHFTSTDRDHHKADSFTKPNPFSSHAKPTTSFPYTKPHPPTGPSFLKAQGTPSSSPVRHLTNAEWEDRRQRDLCFRCGQKFSPPHKCPASGLRVLQLGDVVFMDGDGKVYSLEDAIT